MCRVSISTLDYLPSPFTMILNMPYTLEDQPTEDWTVDQVLHWWLLHAKSETDAVRDELVSKLQLQLEEGMDRLWQDHEQVKAVLEQGGSSTENTDPQLAPRTTHPEKSLNETDKDASRKGAVEVSAAPAAAAPTATKTSTSNRLMIEIVGGDYIGKIYELDNLAHEPAVVGRSRGKKVLKHGISLPKDPEVSTTHGKFLAKGNGKLYFTDDGSTNGSMVNGQLIQSHVEIPLESGMEIQVGGTIMLVSF